jgi:hypothetical protein
MNTNDLIKLARKADLEGDIELADYLDNQLIRVSNKFTDFLQKTFNYSRRPNYNVDFSSLAPDASNLGMIASHPTQRGKPLAKFFQAGLKDKIRTPERLDQIDEQIKASIGKIVSSDTNVHEAVNKFNKGLFATITPAERNALLNHLVNNDKVATRANDISPDDIIKVLSGTKPSLTTKQVTTLSNAGKGLGYGAAATAAGTMYGAYNAAQQNRGYQPGSVDPNASGSPYQSMPEMGGGGMPSMGEIPETGGGGGGGYQGPNYQMPSANQSFQPMQGYQPANQVRELPRTNDQAEPLYPRISPEQAMQNAMYVDKARRFDELNANANRPAAAPIVGGNQEIYGPTQEQAAEAGGIQYITNPTEEIQMPMPGEVAPTPAIQGAGQAIDPLNPTGFDPNNPYNI